MTPTRRGMFVRVVTSLCLALGVPVVAATAAVADGPTTFSNTTAMAIPATGSPNQIGDASPYPSPITVSGMTGSVSNVTVTFNNLTHSIANDIDALLVAPTGQNLMVMSDASNNNTFTFASNATLTFSDAAASGLPGSGAIASGTYQPTNNDDGKPDVFAGLTVSGQTTFAGAFTGIAANGDWKLYVHDDTTGDLGSMAGGWSITITTQTAAVATSTTVATSGSPSLVGGPVTFTATVTAGGSPVTAGSVTFTDGATSLGSANLNGSGQASLTTSSLTERTHTITAAYGGATGFQASNGSVTQVVDNATVVTGNTFCNTGQITTPDRGPGTPYGSHITVSGLAGPITGLTAQLTGVTHSVPLDFDVMLVGPSGAAATLLSDVGGQNPVSGVNLTFDDAAASSVSTTSMTSGTFKPTDDDSGPADSFPAPAPTSTAPASLAGFLGTTGNGTWTLYVVDDATGDLGSINNGWCVTVLSQAPTGTALTSSANPADVGSPVTFTATVTSGGSPVTAGSVTFSVDGTPQAPVALGAAGTATLTTSALAAGTHPVVATYSGTTDLSTSSANLDQVVNLIATSTTLTSSLNPSDVDDPVTLTATVTSGGSPVTTGTVTFSVDGTPQAPIPLGAAGTATLTTSRLAAGTHPVVASYSGTTTFATSSANLDQTVNLVPTSTALTSSANPSNVGDPVTFTATVTSGGSAVTAGTVTFSVDGTPLVTVPVSAAGTAVLTIGSLAGGSHPIVGSYSGTARFAASTANLDQVVTLLPTATGLTSSTNPVNVTESVTFTATVTAGGAPVTTGTVTFTVDGTAQAPVTVDASGVATLTTSALAVGTHPVGASYSGTATYGASTATALDQVVQLRPTATALTSSLATGATGVFGEPVTYTAKVTAVPVRVSIGSVVFTVNGVDQAPVPVDPLGEATFTTTDLVVGANQIDARYSEGSRFGPSQASLTDQVTKRPATLALTASPNPSTDGDPVTVTATVTDDLGGAAPTDGTVSFAVDGGTSTDVAAVNGVATWTTNDLPTGTHAVSASFGDSATHQDATSEVSQTVTPIAVAGGPYTVAEGDSLTLSAAGSSDDADGYQWDLNGDGDYSDATGTAPTLTWADLEALGIDDGPSTHTATLRVTSPGDVTATATAEIDVTNTGPEAVTDGSPVATVGVPFTIKVGALDPSSVDMAADFTYTVDWGDGSPVETVVGPADPPVTHTYTTSGSVTARFSAVDNDGGSGGTLELQVRVDVAPAPTTSSTPTAPSTTSTVYATGTVYATSTATAAAVGTTRYNDGSSGSLSYTGVSIGAPLAWAALLVTLGGAMLFLARRPRSRGQH